MHLVSSGINQFTITSTGASVSTLRVVTGVGALYKHTGYKNFQTVNVNGVYYIIPSTTVDAEDFNSNLSTTLDSAGNLTVRGTLTVSGSIGLGNTTVNGNLSVTGDETINGKLTVLGSTTTVAIMIAGGITVSGAGFPNTIIDGSSGAINNVGGGHKLEIRGAASSDAYMAFHRPGAFAVYFGLAASGQLSVGGWSLGAVLYRLLTEQNSFVIGALSGNASLNATQQVSAYCFVGKLVALGAWNGGLDMRTAQSVSMSAGSTVQGFTMTAGQIARIEVVGNGPITIIQANSRWAVGSPVWGTVVTIVSVWFDGASYFMATQAHNS
jgi:cytoskeletal protein CcmA (bactofilin family)